MKTRRNRGVLSWSVDDHRLQFDTKLRNVLVWSYDVKKVSDITKLTPQNFLNRCGNGKLSVRQIRLILGKFGLTMKNMPIINPDDLQEICVPEKFRTLLSTKNIHSTTQLQQALECPKKLRLRVEHVYELTNLIKPVIPFLKTY